MTAAFSRLGMVAMLRRARVQAAVAAPKRQIRTEPARVERRQLETREAPERSTGAPAAEAPGRVAQALRQQQTMAAQVVRAVRTTSQAHRSSTAPVVAAVLGNSDLAEPSVRAARVVIHPQAPAAEAAEARLLRVRESQGQVRAAVEKLPRPHRAVGQAVMESSSFDTWRPLSIRLRQL